MPATSDMLNIVDICIQSLEYCVVTNPLHYKSVYRLAKLYLDGPQFIANKDKYSQLMLGAYKTQMGDEICGLFAKRKQTNLFFVS